MVSFDFRKEEEKRALIEAEKNRTPEPVTRKQQMVCTFLYLMFKLAMYPYNASISNALQSERKREK